MPVLVRPFSLPALVEKVLNLYIWNVANTPFVLSGTDRSFDANFSNNATVYIFLAESVPNTAFYQFTSNALFEVSAGTTSNFDVSCEVSPSAFAMLTLGVSGELLYIPAG